MTDPRQGSVNIGRDSHGIIINGDHNAVNVGPDYEQYVIAGVKQLRIGLHARARESFQAAIDGGVQSPDLYYLNAVATLRGRKAILASLSDIREAEAYLHAALSLEDRPIFHYFLAYIGYDYYERKSLGTSIPWSESLAQAWRLGVTETDVRSLFALLSTENPFPISRP